MRKKRDGGSLIQQIIKCFASLCIFISVTYLVADITGWFPCTTKNIGIATAFATLSGAILVFSTLEMQRKALNEGIHKNEVERFDSRFYPILSSFRTDAADMTIEGDYISPKGIGVKSSYAGDSAFFAACSMTNIIKQSLNDSSFKELDKEEFDAGIDNFSKMFEALEDNYSLNEDEIDRISQEKRNYIRSIQGPYLITKMGITKEERENYEMMSDEDKESFLLEKLIGYQSSALRKYIKTLRFILQIASQVKDDSERKEYYSHISCLLGKNELKFLSYFREFDIITK